MNLYINHHRTPLYVITSYSIHYTKLYDLSPKEVWTGLEHLEGNTVKIIGDGAVLEEQEVIDGKINLPFAVSNIARITSYNVCYTKLLRKRYIFNPTA